MHAWGLRSLETYRLLLQALDRVRGVTPDLTADFRLGDSTWDSEWDSHDWNAHDWEQSQWGEESEDVDHFPWP